MKNKLDRKEEALAKIKTLIDDFYERIGRESVSDVDIARYELLEQIEEIVNKAEIDKKFLILQKFHNEIKCDDCGKKIPLIEKERNRGVCNECVI